MITDYKKWLQITISDLKKQSQMISKSGCKKQMQMINKSDCKKLLQKAIAKKWLQKLNSKTDCKNYLELRL